MTDKKTIGIAFCWYQLEEWEKLKAVTSDPEILDDTYEEWKSSANNAINQIRAEGNIVIKISVNIDELVTWCKENKYEVNMSARSNFAAYKLRKRVGET